MRHPSVRLRSRRLLTSGLVLLALVPAAWLPVCPLANLLGLPCPSCGLTRAARALLAGEFAQALAFQPLVVAVLPLLAFMAGGAWLGYLRTGVPVPPWEASHPRFTRALHWVLGGVSAALVLVWLLRFAGLLGGPVAVHAGWLEALARH